MAIGDASDMVRRLRNALPDGWFPSTGAGQAEQAPVLTGILAGFAANSAWLYKVLAFAKLQTRIATAQRIWLNGVAEDFFAGTLTRRLDQSDPSFRAAILATLLRPKATRQGLIDALVALTGRTPLIFEPGRPADTGGYASLGQTAGSGCGYGVAGGYGSLELPWQCFVIAYRPHIAGNVRGGGYGVAMGYADIGGAAGGGGQYVALASIQGGVTDADIFACIASVMPAGCTAWTQIQS